MVRLAVPELVRVTVWVLLLPTLTFPKLVLVGLAESKSETPVPERGTVKGESEALLMKERLPVLPLAAAGANVTPTEAE
jgi:hypothetical protein